MSEVKKIPAYRGDKEYIFISYAHTSSEETMRIISRLRDEGYRVWYDGGISSASEWSDTLAEKIEGCSYLIAMVSKDYTKSSFCQDELSYARQLGKEILLIYIENAELPSGLKMLLCRKQAILNEVYLNKEEFYGKLFTAKGIEVCKNGSKSSIRKKESSDTEESEKQTVGGTVTAVTYSGENNYKVFKIGNETVTGFCDGLKAGDNVTVIGKYIENPRFGRQFKAFKITVGDPAAQIREKEALTGAVTEITFSGKNGFRIFKIGGDTVKGFCDALKTGDNVTITGKYEDDPKFGRQFNADKVTVTSAVIEEPLPIREKEVLTGAVTEITFSGNKGFRIFKIDGETVRGFSEELKVHDIVTVSGKYVDDPKFGRQFNADKITVTAAVIEEPLPTREKESLTGTVTEITFSGNKGFRIFKIDGETVKGFSEELKIGDNVTVSGKYADDPKFGRQFNADKVTVIQS